MNAKNKNWISSICRFQPILGIPNIDERIFLENQSGRTSSWDIKSEIAMDSRGN